MKILLLELSVRLEVRVGRRLSLLGQNVNTSYSIDAGVIII